MVSRIISVILWIFHILAPKWAVPAVSGFRALHFSWQTCTSPKLANWNLTTPIPMNSSKQEITTVRGKLFYKLVGFSFSSSLIFMSLITKSLVCWLPKQLFLNPSWKKCFKTFFNKQIPFSFSLQNQLSSPANKRLVFFFSLGFTEVSYIFSTSFENCK